MTQAPGLTRSGGILFGVEMYLVKKSFSWAHHGYYFVDYAEGDDLSSDDPGLIEVALREGWIEPKKVVEKKAIKAAPENK